MAAHSPSQLVVKDNFRPTLDELTEEHRIIELLNDTGSTHLIREPVGPHEYAAHAGDYERLFLDYCPHGDLDHLLALRREKCILQDCTHLESD